MSTAHVNPEETFEEQHFTPSELAKLWKLSDDTIRTIFRNEPGVVRLQGKESKNRGRVASRREYISLRIPRSVALRVWSRRAGL